MPTWETREEGKQPDRELCRQGDHVWIAVFFESGQLAYWECENCGEKDREIGQSPEQLDVISGWIKSPPVLVSRSPRPATSNRRWATSEGSILAEGDPSSIHFIGEPIPGLAEAHTYVQYGENGQVEDVYEPLREHPCLYSNHYLANPVPSDRRRSGAIRESLL